MMGSAKPASPPSRCKAAARKLDGWSAENRMNCLGYMARDRGHSRVPEPPESMTGKIAPMWSWPWPGTGAALAVRARGLKKPDAGVGQLDEDTGRARPRRLTLRPSSKRWARSLL